MAETEDQRRARLAEALGTLTASQTRWVAGVVAAFAKPREFQRDERSDLVSPQVLDDIGDTLRIHHCFSREAFSKDKFEYALERIVKDDGRAARLAPRGNPGYDIEIDGERISLKTEASAKINVDKVHISKFMELGGGQWGDDPHDLVGLRDQFFAHMRQYARIFVLRRLPENAAGWLRYELVEIPKTLLLEAENGTLEMKTESTQKGAKPGYCYVKDRQGNQRFALYFDGGGERKLQVKGLLKTLCRTHATWSFAV